jgi:hypothetical protein
MIPVNRYNYHLKLSAVSYNPLLAVVICPFNIAAIQ